MTTFFVRLQNAGHRVAQRLNRPPPPSCMLAPPLQAMCYILALNGIILSGTGISKNGSFFATALSSGIFTMVMGYVANVPIALAPGMGLNGYFASLVMSGRLDFKNALGAVFLSGVLYSFFTLTGLRAAIFKAIPAYMRTSISVGVGFFIAMIGLKIGEITRITLTSPYAVKPDNSLAFW